jgi:hypothetical protein
MAAAGAMLTAIFSHAADRIRLQDLLIRPRIAISLMRNLGCGFLRRKLGQNLGKESTPNRVKIGL